MIDFAFYTRMRSELLNPFNANNYTPDQLQMLAESPSLITSKYCSKSFREGFQNYLKKNPELKEIANKHQINTVQKIPNDEAVCLKFITENETLEAAIKAMNCFKINYNNIEFLVIKGSCYEFDLVLESVNEKFNYKENYIKTLKIIDYYSEWLCSQNNYSFMSAFDFFLTVMKCAHSDEVSDLLIALAKVDNLGHIFDDNIKMSWLDDETWDKIPDFFKPQFWQDIIHFKGWAGVELGLRALQEYIKFEQAINSLTPSSKASNASDEDISTLLDNIRIDSRNIDRIYDSLNLALKVDPNYPEISAETYKIATDKGFDIAKLKFLGAKYQMPTMVLRKFLEEELTKFNPEDHLAEVLSPIFQTLNNGNTNSFPIGKLFSGKATTVSLLPKTDPTAIFVGKMTNSCQHYMGDSSEEAVIPVYTDPNAGLIVVTIGKDVKTVKAACFAWLSRKEDGSIDGLVLDSFEAPGKDCDKAFLPLISGLAKGLNARGLNLYVGTGGHTPELLLGGYLVEAQDAPNPLTTDYEPYGDASEVYVINPDFKYTFNSKQYEANEEIEELNIGDYVENWSSDLLEEFNKLPKVLEYIKKYGSVNAQYQEFFQTILENLNIDSLTSLAKYVDLIAKIIEYGGAYHNELANLNSILGLDITLDYEPWFASLDQLEKEVENMSRVAEYKIQLKAFFAALPVDEKNTETLKKIEAFFEDIYYIYKEPNFSYVTQFTTRLNQENLPIIEEYFDILGKIRSYHPTWLQGRELYQSHQILDTTPIQDGEVRTTLQSVKRWLEIYEIQEQNKSILAGYKEQLNQAIQSSPYLSTHDHLASKFKDIFERSTDGTIKGLPVLLQLLTSEKGLTPEILAQIEKFFELYDQMLTVNNNTWTFNELQLASILDPTNQLLDTVNTSFIELEEKLEARKIATNLSFYKNRLKNLILTINKNTSSVKTLEKIIKLGKEIDIFSEDKDLIAIPIICSNLTKKSFHLIEEYFSLIERIEELKIPNWKASLSNIADILNIIINEENKPGVSLDTLRDIINQHEASLEASSAIASSEESAPPVPETNEEVQIGGDCSPL